MVSQLRGDDGALDLNSKSISSRGREVLIVVDECTHMWLTPQCLWFFVGCLKSVNICVLLSVVEICVFEKNFVFFCG